MEILRDIRTSKKFLKKLFVKDKPLVSPTNLLVHSEIISFDFPPEGGNRLVHSYFDPEVFEDAPTLSHDSNH